MPLPHLAKLAWAPDASYFGNPSNNFCSLISAISYDNSSKLSVFKQERKRFELVWDCDSEGEEPPVVFFMDELR